MIAASTDIECLETALSHLNRGSTVYTFCYEQQLSTLEWHMSYQHAFRKEQEQIQGFSGCCRINGACPQNVAI